MIYLEIVHSNVNSISKLSERWHLFVVSRSMSKIYLPLRNSELIETFNSHPKTVTIGAVSDYSTDFETCRDKTPAVH
jgi:hypothetical protein